MGRRLNISTPTVIQTELIPLDESFYIEEQGQVEQWYYDNTNQYAPNRTISPLTLVPHVSCFDGDTQTTYTPSFYITRWYEKYYDATLGDYTEREITNIQDSSTADYVKVGNNLLVKKNVPYTHSITIRCEATYIDPRDSGVTYVTGDTVLLTTNRDAKTVYPQLDILCPSSQSYNPLVDAQSRFEMKATADYSAVVKSDVLEYGVDPLGTEEIAPNNDDALVNAAPVMDIRYGDLVEYDQQFMRRITSDQQASSIDGNKAFLQKVVGNTVSFNQICEFIKETDTFVGITRTYSNGVIHLNGTASAAYQRKLSSSTDIGYVDGHKYLLRFSSLQNKNATLQILYNNNNNVLARNLVDSYFFTYQSSLVNISLYAATVSGATLNNVIIDACIFDLTLMGIDNLTTVAEVEEYLEANLGKKDYYPYTAGKLVNFGGYGVKMNQLVQNGDFANGTTGIYAETGVELSWSDGIVTFINASDSNGRGIRMIGGTTVGHVYYNCCKCRSTSGATLRLILGSAYKQITATSKDWNRISLTMTANAAPEYNYLVDMGKNHVVDVESIFLIDLTEMFGAGNEPTLEECNAIFTADYYPYNAGTSMNVLDVMGKEVGMKTTGFNVWDEEWELNTFNTTTDQFGSGVQVIASKNYIPILAGETYYLKAPYNFGSNGGHRIFYDSSKNFISRESYNASATAPSNAAFLKLAFPTSAYGSVTYNHDICINVSDPSRNGTYEAHWERFAKFDVTKITGINSVTHQREVMFPDGMKKAGASVFDSIYVNGGKIEAKKMCGDVDMSSLEWTATGSAGHLLVSNVINPTIKYIDASTPIKGCCSNRQIIAENGAWGTDKISGTGGSHVYVYVENNASYNPITGMLVYELETPVIYTDLKYEDGSDVAFPFTYEWYGIDNDSEVLADTLPWYVEGQDTDKITVDAMYGEDIRVLLRARDTNGNLIPPRVYRSIHWRTPDIDSNVACKNGSAVRSDSEDMTFETIINVKGAVLDDNKKNAHLRFNWKTRKNNVSTEVDKGWGLTKTLHADELMNVIGQSSSLASTLVFPYVYLRGAYEKVTYNGSEVTDDGAVVFDRPVTD